MVVLWLFSEYLSTAFGTWVWPLIGFFLLPTTTLAYAVAENRYGGVKGVGLVLVILGVLVDLGAIAAGAGAPGNAGPARAESGTVRQMGAGSPKASRPPRMPRVRRGHPLLPQLARRRLLDGALPGHPLDGLLFDRASGLSTAQAVFVLAFVATFGWVGLSAISPPSRPRSSNSPNLATEVGAKM